MFSRRHLLTHRMAVLCLVATWLLTAPTVAAESKPRLLVLTDIGGDPDDQQSLVRLLVHANEFDIEGLIASASGTPGELTQHVTQPQLIREQIRAYEQVLPNLRKHASGFPEAATLLAAVKAGNSNRGRDFVGPQYDSDGSRWIVACGDQPDDRPLNIAIWGGQTDLAQALWRVRQDRGDEGYQQFRSKLRVFDIDDQDRIHDWLVEQFPDLFYVLSKAPPGMDKRLGAYRGMYLGGDQSLTSLDWINQHIRSGHGPLGALYPSKTWTAPNPHSALKEGDTPSWFFFLTLGLSDPAHPEWGGWGGRYLRQPSGVYRDAPDTVGDVTDTRAAVWRWREAYQHEFSARLDWCVTDDVSNANHPPVAVVNGDRSRQAIQVDLHPGRTITLSSADSSDPDGDVLQRRWFVYAEAGTMHSVGELSGLTGESVQLRIPRESARGTVHVILALSDDGTPPLTRYRRVLARIQP